jgi:mono/diheme cytochrome c family protein
MRLYFVLISLSVMLIACNNNDDNDNTKDASSEIQPTQTINIWDVTLPAFSTIPQVAEAALIAADDPRLPIEPNPGSQALYEQNCASCHGINGEGQYPEAPYQANEQGLVGAPPHDVTGHTWHHPDQALIKIIHDGQSFPNYLPMPAFGDKLTVDQIISILAYIKTWWGPQELEMQRGVTETYQP